MVQETLCNTSITVPRSYPIYANWTYKDIKVRESIEIKEGGFRYRFPLDPIKCDTNSKIPSAATSVINLRLHSTPPANVANQNQKNTDNYDRDEKENDEDKQDTDIENGGCEYNKKNTDDVRKGKKQKGKEKQVDDDPIVNAAEKGERQKGGGEEMQLMTGRRKTTRTETFLSPYVVRQISAVDNLTNDEAVIAYFTFYHDQDTM